MFIERWISYISLLKYWSRAHNFLLIGGCKSVWTQFTCIYNGVRYRIFNRASHWINDICSVSVARVDYCFGWQSVCLMSPEIINMNNYDNMHKHSWYRTHTHLCTQIHKLEQLNYDLSQTFTLHLSEIFIVKLCPFCTNARFFFA